MSEAIENKPVRALEIAVPIKVKTYDIDSAGHVSNIVYLRWMEDLRLELMERHFSYQSFIEAGYQPIIAATEIQYKRAVKLFDRPIGHMWIESLSAASMRFHGEIVVNGEVTTRAFHTGVFVDVTSGRPRRMPQVVIQKFRQAQERL
ncbi:MAG TPA: thioesterase family protein [Chroococcales cyanobacterium]